MKFCPVCQNMLHEVVESEAGVGLKCRKCEYIEKIDHTNPLVYERNMREDSAAKVVMNPYLTQDPTLPHFTTIRCPTDGCRSDDVVGVKVDAQNIVWLYQCAVCNVSWKQAARRG